MSKKILGAVVCAVALTACARAAAPTPPPVPTVPQCTPLDGGAPYACTQSEHDTLAEQHALYEEAEQVLRRYDAELNRQEADWRLREMTPEFEATTTGEFRDVVQRFIGVDRDDEARRVNDAAEIAWVKPAVGLSHEGSIAALQWCTDASVERYETKASETPSTGVITRRTSHFVRDQGQLKISHSVSERVESC